MDLAVSVGLAVRCELGRELLHGLGKYRSVGAVKDVAGAKVDISLHIGLAGHVDAAGLTVLFSGLQHFGRYLHHAGIGGLAGDAEGLAHVGGADKHHIDLGDLADLFSGVRHLLILNVDNHKGLLVGGFHISSQKPYIALRVWRERPRVPSG